MRAAIAAALLFVAVGPALPAAGHDTESFREFESGWLAAAEGGLTPELLDEKRVFYEENPTARWLGLVERYFPWDRVSEAMEIMECESRGDPGAKNPDSTAAGLFQFLDSTWDRIAVPLGYGPYGSGDEYDPEANVHAASALLLRYERSGWWPWQAWACSRVLR